MNSENKRMSTARARELGRELLRRREAARLNGQDLARMLAWSPSKVCRLEKGLRGSSEVDVANYYVACGPVEQAEYERLVAMAKETDEGYWLRQGGEKIPEQLRSLIVQESMASRITTYTPTVVPGLLQTEQYMRELFRWRTTLSQEAVRHRIGLRLQRQKVLRVRGGPSAVFFVQEHALRTVVGNSTVMQDQLLHLVFSSTGRCSIRVVPDSAGPFAMIGETFYLLQYTEHLPVVYADTWTAGLFVEKPEAVAQYREYLTKLGRAALDEGQSREWLASLASEYDRTEAAPDDRQQPSRAELAQEQLQR